MYTRRAAISTFKSLRLLLKVRGTRAPEFPCSIRERVPGFVRDFGTAAERLGVHTNLDGNFTGNQEFQSIYNQNGSFSGSDLRGAEQNINPSRVYGQGLNGQYGNSVTEDSNFSNTSGADNVGNRCDYSFGNQNNRFHGMHLDASEQNRNPNWLYGQDFDVERGNFASRDVGNGRQNGNFNGQSDFRGYYGGNEDMSRQSGYNTAMYQPSVAGNYGNNVSQVTSDMNPNVESVELSQSRSKIEDLDEFTKEGKLKEAVELLGQLQQEGVQVELPRYMALMKACGENEALDEAKSVHGRLLKSYAHLEVRTYNWIIEMYSKCGSMKDAFEVFDQMPKRNLTSWDIMISWLAKNGHGEDSIELFTQFKGSGLKPDGHMFIGAFSACGVVCDIVEGMLHFESMMKDYEIVPTMDHYVSVVDMLGNAGCLDEALEFIQSMLIEPSIDIWETLMKFCRIH